MSNVDTTAIKGGSAECRIESAYRIVAALEGVSAGRVDTHAAKLLLKGEITFLGKMLVQGPGDVEVEIEIGSNGLYYLRR